LKIAGHPLVGILVEVKMVTAVFPGTFDPIHLGHIDIANRSSKLFDKLIVAVYDRPMKNLLFSPDERIQLVKKSLKNNSKISVVGFSGLTVRLCKQVGAQVIVRGLRVFSDFELEFRMALANHRLAPKIEVVAFITAEDHSFISSSTVKEIALLKGDVSTMVPSIVLKALQRRFKEIGNRDHELSISSLRD
jgi:pantetheine-phosphate adenylyltransferase